MGAHKRYGLKILRIEKEYGKSFKEIIRELCEKNDYINHRFGVYNLSQIFDIPITVLHSVIAKNKINCPIFCFPPSRIEDYCWTRWGITLEQYLKTRFRWMTEKEMADELKISKTYIQRLFKKYNISKKQKVSRGRWEF